jgi:two-component system NtrC family sensor kinase
VLETLGTPEGVQRVRIYNHQGNVLFSSNLKNVGTPVDRTSLACTSCHSDLGKSAALIPDPVKWSVHKDEKGSTSLKMVSEIPNEPDCYNASCHVHPREQEVLGFVEADLSLALLDEALFKQGLALTVYVIVFVLAVSMFLGIINYKIMKSGCWQAPLTR